MTVKERTRKDFLRIAENTDVFNAAEMEILDEVLTEHHKAPEQDYFLLSKENEGELQGYIIFGRTPLTKCTWDIYWLVVGRQYQRNGIGQALLHMAEAKIKEAGSNAVIRIETSTREVYNSAHKLYKKNRYTIVGMIENFYHDNDDLLVYSKQIVRS